MLTALRTWWWDRRVRRREERLAGIVRGSGWDRLSDDPVFDYMQRMAESPGGQPPRVRYRRGR